MASVTVTKIERQGSEARLTVETKTSVGQFSFQFTVPDKAQMAELEAEGLRRARTFAKELKDTIDHSAS